MGISIYFDLITLLLFVLIWVVLIFFLRSRKRKSLVYLMFFTIFYVYIVAVFDYTLFQFQSLIVLKLFMPNLILNGQAEGKSFNLVPLITLTAEDLVTSLLNILLFIPFGFGLPFITKLRMKNVVLIGLLISISIELLQFITGIIAKITFRVADVNDVIFNTLGVMVGYFLFLQFLWLWHRIFRNSNAKTNPIVRYISDRPQLNN